jgi:hypothetical protein
MTAALNRSDLNASPTVADLEEAPARRQPGRLVTLFVEGQEPFEVRITNRERIAYEKVSARHPEWPPTETGQHFAMTFVCWAAAKRAGLTSTTFEQWQDLLEDYDVLEEPADPTR